MSSDVSRAILSCCALLLLACASGDDPAPDAGPSSGSDAATIEPDASARADGSAALDGGPSAADGSAPGTDGGVGARDGGGSRIDAGPEECGLTRADTSSPGEGASWRYGGGVGYPDAVRPDGPCTTVVRTRAELEAALDGARPGEVVYVADDARIDLTGATLCVPGGVTLASGRGRDGRAGGLLFVTTTESRAMLRACGDGVRVSGLRLWGHEPTQCPPEWPDRCTGEDRTGGRNCRDCMPRSRGIQARSVNGLEVDNVEMTGWTYGAVELRDSLDAHVHHSHLHHNQRQGLGYGVVLSNVTDPATAEIHHNRFDYNRHSVAGSGAVGHSYEARDNLVLSHANGHVFDMHGIDEATSDGTPWAGTRILVHHNTVLPADHYALVVRGQPTEGSWLWDNCLARSSPDTAALQRRYFGDFHVDRSPSGAAPNRYGRSAAQCEPVRFCVSSGGEGPWRYLARSGYPRDALALGDFDGDGRADVFRPDGEAWHWLPAGGGGWMQLNASGATLGSLAFGDFDGDGRTDVFRASGSEWLVSDGGASSWRTINASSATLGSLAFGDFDGDGRTDVFRATGSEWQVSDGGAAPWRRLNASSYTLGSLAFGDFDGDGETDVFRASGSEWHFSSGGTAAWDRLNASSATLGSLAFADVDGDGRTDVLRASSGRWRVSYGARGGWQTLAISDQPLSAVAFADLDGDGRDDAFRTGCL